MEKTSTCVCVYKPLGLLRRDSLVCIGSLFQRAIRVRSQPGDSLTERLKLREILRCLNVCYLFVFKSLGYFFVPFYLSPEGVNQLDFR